jgi:peptide/nickel transport system permease protein
MLLWKIARRLLVILAIVLIGAFISATLVRLAPGFDTDEHQLDPTLSTESIHALNESRAGEQDVLRFYLAYLRNALHGDLGTSHALGQPVLDLLRERWQVTLRIVTCGLLLGWLLAITLAFAVSLARVPVFEIFGTAFSGTFLCIPAAVLALLSVVFNSPGYLAIALIVFPKIYRYACSLLAKTYAKAHITAARARGLGEPRILFWHVVPIVAPQIIALGGVTVSVALGAAIPIESFCGLPGIGQLAWQAALARDLPLLVNITVLVTLVTLLANSGADVINHMVRSGEA